MPGSVQQEPAYVLHRRPYRETSLLVDLFTLNNGRMTVVARGANGPRSPLKAQLQPFQPLLVDWQGRSDLKTLTQTDNRPGVSLGHGRALYSGFYLNELLQKLLPAGEASHELFVAYLAALAELASGADVEPILRRFEGALAESLGYGFAWDAVAGTGESVREDRIYCYDPQQGILASPAPQARLQRLPGSVLLSIATGNLAGDAERRVGKQVMRALVDFLLQGKPLNSRGLFGNKPST